jgi:hypothetical protein
MERQHPFMTDKVKVPGKAVTDSAQLTAHPGNQPHWSPGSKNMGKGDLGELDVIMRIKGVTQAKLSGPTSSSCPLHFHAFVHVSISGMFSYPGLKLPFL